MLQFVKDGPEIPHQVLSALEENKLVLFCGAGISLYSGLPLFGQLTEDVWKAVQPVAEKSPAEKVALEAKQYDRFLGLLEQRLVTGEVRKAVSERLSKPTTNTLDYHQALLKIAQLPDGNYRLVTTNFDRRFLEAGIPRTQVDTAPRLPVPKPSAWNTLVQLHGLIEPTYDPSGRNLVLTTADFGRAYLTEGWASRFLTDLFREFTVLFIGYSIDDPIVSYLMSALAAERSSSTQFKEAYAFSSYDGSQEGEQEFQYSIWQSKGVIPIPFDTKEDWRLLKETIIEWARSRTSDRSYRIGTIQTAAQLEPRGGNDFYSRQLIWALLDSDGYCAHTFATFEPCPSLNWWFEVFETVQIPMPGNPQINTSLSEMSMGTFIDPAGIKKPLVVPLVDRKPIKISDIHPVTLELSRWLCKHLADPRLLKWVVEKGAYLHTRFNYEIRKSLERYCSELNPGLLKAWTLLTSPLHFKEREHFNNMWMGTYNPRFENGQVNHLSLEEMIATLSCSIKISIASEWHKSFISSDSIRHFLDCSLELTNGSRQKMNVEDILAKDKNRSELLSMCLDQLTNLISDALNLLTQFEQADRQTDPSIYSLPSISDHKENEYSPDWTFLVTLARDGMEGLVRIEPSKASAVLLKWSQFQFPIFKRLVLHAVTENEVLDLNIIEEVLTENNSSYLWSDSTKREVLRFLRKAGNRLSPKQLRILEKHILKGPPKSKFRKGLKKIDVRNYSNHEIWIRLSKLLLSGANVSKEATDFLDKINRDKKLQLAEDYKDELSIWHDTYRWSTDTEQQKDDRFEKLSPNELVNFISNNNEVLPEHWRYISAHRPHVMRKVLKLMPLAHKSDLRLWKQIVVGQNSVHNARTYRRTWILFGPLIADLPESVVAKISIDLCRWLDKFSREVKKEEVSIFLDIALKILPHLPNETLKNDQDFVSTALNSAVGQLTSALLILLRCFDLRKNQGIPEELISVYDRLVSLPDNLGIVSNIMFARDLHILFWLDEKWTTKNLISKMNGADEECSAAIWAGYLWQPRYTPDLVIAYKTGFLEMLGNLSKKDLRRAKENLFTLLAALVTDCSDCFSKEDLIFIGKSFDSESLAQYAFSLARLLDIKSSENKLYWSEVVKPVFQFTWRTDEHLQSETTARALAKLTIAARNEFPDALNAVAAFLRKTDYIGDILNKIRKYDLAGKHPQLVVHLLFLILPNNLESHQYLWLASILKSVKRAWAECESSIEYKYLAEISDKLNLTQLESQLNTQDD